jgi:hypothetical protein
LQESGPVKTPPPEISTHITIISNAPRAAHEEKDYEPQSSQSAQRRKMRNRLVMIKQSSPASYQSKLASYQLKLVSYQLPSFLCALSGPLWLIFLNDESVQTLD